MGLFSPWVNYKNKQLFTNMKIKQTTLRFNIKHLQGMNTMGPGREYVHRHTLVRSLDESMSFHFHVSEK